MQFTINREDLLKPLLQVAGVVERRHTQPVLSNILVEVGDNRLSMTGTDMELELNASVALVGDVTQGATTIPARKLVDICKNLPAEADVSFSLENERLTIRSGRSRFTLGTLPAADFPRTDDTVEGTVFKVAPAQLRRVIDSAAFSMAQQDVRFYLNGMLFQLKPGLLRTVATDGHRLALSEAQVETVDADMQVIVPRKGVNELSRLLADYHEDVQVVLGDKHIRLQIKELTFTSHLVDATFPDFERVIPKSTTKAVSADRELLRQSMQRASILSNEKYRGVRFLLAPQTLRLVANNPEQEEAFEELSVGYDGEEFEIGFNVNYLLDVLNILNGTEVLIELGDSNSSAVIVDPDAEGSLYVVMPMRL